MLSLRHMDNYKIFLIHQQKDSTSVTRSPELGRILFRPEINVIAAQFGSIVLRVGGETVIDIVPPVKDEEIPILGDALVDLAKTLDPSPPEPIYKIT
jgi:hypothetical protein